jgi:hypothetical protein
VTYPDIAVVRSKAQPVGSRRIEPTQVLDPLLTRPTLAVLPTAQLGTRDAGGGQSVSVVQRIKPGGHLGTTPTVREPPRLQSEHLRELLADDLNDRLGSEPIPQSPVPDLGRLPR